jgi:hypothetical protein
MPAIDPPPDLDHVDHRRLDRQAGAALEAVHARSLHHRGDLDAAVLDQAGLGGRAAHVERDHAVLACELAEQRGRKPAAGRAGFEQPDRELARRGGRHQAAGRVHQPQGTTESACGQLVLEIREIAVHQRLHIGIGAGRHRTRILAQLRHHVGGERDEQVGKFLGDQRAHRLLVRRIGIGMQEADRDRLDPVIDQPAHRGAHLVRVEPRDHAAVAVHPLADLEPVAPRHQRIGKAEEQVVDVVTLLGAHFEAVAEALRGQQPEPGATPLDDRVGDQRRAVHDLGDVTERDAGLPGQLAQALERGDRGVLRRGQAFVERDAFVMQHEVGKCAADVEADSCHAGAFRSFRPAMLGAFAACRNANRAPWHDATAGQTYPWLCAGASEGRACLAAPFRE